MCTRGTVWRWSQGTARHGMAVASECFRVSLRSLQIASCQLQAASSADTDHRSDPEQLAWHPEDALHNGSFSSFSGRLVKGLSGILGEAYHRQRAAVDAFSGGNACTWRRQQRTGTAEWGSGWIRMDQDGSCREHSDSGLVAERHWRLFRDFREL